MEERDGFGKKRDCCGTDEGNAAGETVEKAGHEPKGMMKHGMGMMLCCLAPVVMIAAIPLLGLRQGGTYSFLASLICPIGMMVMMFSMSRMNGKGGSCHGTKEKGMEDGYGKGQEG